MSTWPDTPRVATSRHSLVCAGAASVTIHAALLIVIARHFDAPISQFPLTGPTDLVATSFLWPQPVQEILPIESPVLAATQEKVGLDSVPDLNSQPQVLPPERAPPVITPQVQSEHESLPAESSPPPAPPQLDTASRHRVLAIVRSASDFLASFLALPSALPGPDTSPSPVAASHASGISRAAVSPAAPKLPSQVSDGSGSVADSFGSPIPHPGNKAPQYPAESRRLKQEGEVLLRLDVGDDGSPLTVSIARSSGYDQLDRAAVEAASSWRFTPATTNGTPTRCEITFPITFALRK